MIRYVVAVLILISFSASVWSSATPEITDNFEQTQKSAAKAMLLSTVFPGAGQFYANRSSITTYIFPIIEVGLFVGYLHYQSKGDDKEREYEKFADQHYSRERQNFAQNDLINTANNPLYDDHFRLDEENTQHYYEDIGKYNKYIFGWADWFEIHATLPGSPNTWTNIDWIFDEDDLGRDLWVGTNPQNTESPYYNENYEDPYTHYSELRADYVKMRHEAEDLYTTSRYFSFGMVFNRLFSAIDAIRLSKQHNRQFARKDSSTPNYSFRFSPMVINNNLSAGLMVNTRF